MEILTTLGNPVCNAGVIANMRGANRNGAPVRSPLVRLQEILAESNSCDDLVSFLPLRSRKVGRA